VGIFVALVFLLLGLSMMGLFEIALPYKWTGKIEQEKKKGKGYLGAFFIGALSGLVASPCIGPLLLAILVIVASVGSVILGFVYLFAFALGMGILFIVIGTFSGILSSLPKSGGWMDLVKVLFGALILAASFYFGALYLPLRLFFLCSGTVVGFLIAFMVFGGSRHFFSLPVRVTGSILTAAAFAAILPFTQQLGDKAGGKDIFLTDINEAAAKAGAEKKPLLLDFGADWCVACLELEKKTWPSAQAGNVFSEVVPLKLDFTKESELRKELEAYFKIEGLPTVILLEPIKADEADGKNTGN
jgi:thiol:disulfide interchange protein DsbD